MNTESPHIFMVIVMVIKIIKNTFCAYTLSNLKIRCDVILYLRRVTINVSVVYEIAAKRACFKITRSEERNVLRVTSRLI